MEDLLLALQYALYAGVVLMVIGIVFLVFKVFSIEKNW